MSNSKKYANEKVIIFPFSIIGKLLSKPKMSFQLLVLFSTSVKITEKRENLKKIAPSEKIYGFECYNFQI